MATCVEGSDDVILFFAATGTALCWRRIDVCVCVCECTYTYMYIVPKDRWLGTLVVISSTNSIHWKYM